MVEILSEVEAAEIRASVYAPPPAQDPIHAGMMGLFMVGAVLSLFTGLAGIDQDRVMFAIVVVLALGFGLPYLYFWSQQRRHSEAFVRELVRIQKERREAVD